MNVTTNIDRIIYDKIMTGEAYVHIMKWYSSLDTHLAHLVFIEDDKYYNYTMSRCLYESIMDGQYYIQWLTPVQAQIDYFSSSETKEERTIRLERELNEAVSEEDYERAARLRDQINEKK